MEENPCACLKEERRGGVSTMLASACLVDIRFLHHLAGEYPSRLEDVAKQLHITKNSHPEPDSGKLVNEGNPEGLYRLVLGNGQNVFVANGIVAPSTNISM